MSRILKYAVVASFVTLLMGFVASFMFPVKIDMNSVRNLIDYITSCPGWLIFATHDVTHNPSPYGITPEFFAEVVEYAASSSAFILPVAEAAGKLQGTI